MSDAEQAGVAAALTGLARALVQFGITDFAVTGSVALGVWATPRHSRDIDLCGSVPPEAVVPLLARFDGLRGGTEDIPDVIRFRFGDWDIDLFVSKDEYDRQCLSRAIPATIAGVSVKVVTPEDFLIHKLVKLRSDRQRMLQDLADMRAVIGARGPALDRTYLARWLPTPERELVDSLDSLDDEAAARRLLGLAVRG